VKGAIPYRMLAGVAGSEIPAARIFPSTTTAAGNNDLEISCCVCIGAANMSGIDADDELFASIARKLHLELTSFIHLRSRTPRFLGDLVVEPLADTDRPLADSCMRLGRLDGQEFREHAGRLSIRDQASQPCRQFHQLGRCPIRADFLERRERGVHPWMAIRAQHPAGVANLHRAEHRSNSTRRIVLDWPKVVAIRADPSKQAVGFRLLVHDCAPQRDHDLLAIVDRQAKVSVTQTLIAFVDPDLSATDVAEFVRPLDRNRPLHSHHYLRNQRDGDGPVGANKSWPP
jgi:hypothetical protein